MLLRKPFIIWAQPKLVRPERWDGTGTCLVLRCVWVLGSEAVHLAIRASAHEPVSLERLVILDMLLELAQRVAGRRTLGATAHERHVDLVYRVDGSYGSCMVSSSFRSKRSVGSAVARINTVKMKWKNREVKVGDRGAGLFCQDGRQCRLRLGRWRGNTEADRPTRLADHFLHNRSRGQHVTAGRLLSISHLFFLRIEVERSAGHTSLPYNPKPTEAPTNCEVTMLRQV